MKKIILKTIDNPFFNNNHKFIRYSKMLLNTYLKSNCDFTNLEFIYIFQFIDRS